MGEVEEMLGSLEDEEDEADAGTADERPRDDPERAKKRTEDPDDLELDLDAAWGRDGD